MLNTMKKHQYTISYILLAVTVLGTFIFACIALYCQQTGLESFAYITNNGNIGTFYIMGTTIVCTIMGIISIALMVLLLAIDSLMS